MMKFDMRLINYKLPSVYYVVVTGALVLVMFLLTLMFMVASHSVLRKFMY